MLVLMLGYRHSHVGLQAWSVDNDVWSREQCVDNDVGLDVQCDVGSEPKICRQGCATIGMVC